MSPDLVLLPVGIAVGAVNAVAGGGMLLSFPVWLALGYSPLVANVSNTIGIFPSNVGGVWAYRDDLKADRRLLLVLVLAAVGGSVTGAGILLALPEAAFEQVVPFLIGVAALLVVFQRTIVGLVRSNAEQQSDSVRAAFALVYLASVYGGYFGATSGVILLAVLGLSVAGGLQRLNALKNASALAINLAGMAVFASLADVAWQPALYQAAGTLVGGFAGARLARRLPEGVFRGVVVAAGLAGVVAVVAG